MPQKVDKLKNARKNKLRLPSCGKFFIAFLVLGALTSYCTYKFITTPPEKPIVDLEQWWGPYPMDINKDMSIRPYKIEFSDEMVEDLRKRLLNRRPFTAPLTKTGFTYGFNSNFLNTLMDTWTHGYVFKDREKYLNQYEHYITNIQGLDIHYMHVKPKPTNLTVVPILMLHGWPSSIREFYELIPWLNKPRHKDFVFEIIAPSLPGFAFSQGPARAGMGPIEIAVVFRNLMHRIGHKRYYVQGGDLGHAVGSIMATMFPENILGFHSNMPLVSFNPVVIMYTLIGSIWPSQIVDPKLVHRMYPLSSHVARMFQETGYFHIQATKPDTVGIALSDSPSGLAAYILEKYAAWTSPHKKHKDDGGLKTKFDLIDLLDCVMIYWSTNCITTSMRHYIEGMMQLAYMDQIPTEVPTWGIKFKYELYFQPDCILKLKYKNYIQSTVVGNGGHFPAMESPSVLADDMFNAVEAFRDFHSKQGDSESQFDKPKTIYDFTVKDIQGREVKLEKYRGKVVLIVNVASECLYTRANYMQLNNLYHKYSKKGLRILAFPCNQFGGQEPDAPSDILEFTKKKYVKFDVFEIVEVNGRNTHPLWQFLKTAQGGTFGDFIKWNFSKFIVDRNGVPVERFSPNVYPMELEPHLAKYW